MVGALSVHGFAPPVPRVDRREDRRNVVEALRQHRDKVAPVGVAQHDAQPEPLYRKIVPIKHAACEAGEERA